jgi:two-component system cell cycle sensor histidine kinase/response regulator CckA
MTKKPTYEELEQKVKKLEKERKIVAVSRDISEQKKVIKALMESINKYRNIIEGIEEAYFEVDITGNLTFFNASLCKMLGYKSDKLMGLNNRAFMSQETAKKAYQVFNKVYSTGKPADIYDWELILKDGSKIYVEGSVSLIRDAEGNRIGFRGISRDITKKVRAEKALRESEAKYRSVFEKTGTATVIIEEDMTISMANTEFEKLSGMSKQEIEGKMKWTEFVAGEDLEKMKRYHTERREKGMQAPGQYEFRFIDKQGNIKHVFINVGVISGTKKSVASLTDITEHKRIEEALRESEEKYRLLVENANDAIFIAQDEVVKFPNPRVEELTGYSVEELAKKPFIEFIHPGDRGMVLERHLKRLKGEDFPSTYPFRIINRSGQELWVELSTVLISWEGRPATLNFIRDITEKKKVEIKLLQSQRMEAVATLAGGVAHQFNNALSAITGNIGLIEMDYPQNKGIMQYIQAMKASVHRMVHLTNQLLAYAKGGKYSPKTIVLTDFIEDALPLIQHTIKPTIRVETDLPHDILSVKIDITQMQTVLSAIIANSDEAITEKGRIRIIARNEEIGREVVKIHPDFRPGTYVCLKVEDDGTGMDEETKSRIFEPFYTTKFTGRGLSMAAVHGIVDNHDGWISIDSEQGKGTTVTIYLPAVEAEEEKVEVKRPGLVKGTGTILVIEDEEAIMDLNRQLLERMGYRVLEARTGKEAVDLAGTFDGHIDLALLDIKLPDMGGEKVYPLLMKSRPDLKVIVCSGYSIDGPVQEILDAGAQAFIQKPFSPVPFSEKIREILVKNVYGHEKKP